MVRARAASNEHADSGSAGPRTGGRPRDATLDEAIILATRDRLVRDGYSQMTIGDIAADAKVSRPTLYRRWSTKFELVVDAMDYGFRQERDTYALDASRMEPREALVEAVRRLDPAYFTPNAMVLMGNFASEAIHTPELLEILRRQAVEPRVTLVENVLSQLQQRGAVHDEIDKHTIATMCFGGYFAAFYRGENTKEMPETVVATLWPLIAKRTAAGRRGSATDKRAR
ncbi:TetR/AcrR family transcriptional regulator [Pseudonocardia alaniniphila]|uniref:TetR/AcrR family transcriptional regulator n=1 Tax=Pseudonocardia alaniniphila TaxID=75291 RepID=A0ABS9T9E4_9PSEU|nr:TetR/AcrR family transcriptional regulator [Pseudonocardia alaniniphila]MCH6165043.1 TetR/AcrR family transcriptional regulator [Pseudonocardia alaniniphila]